MTTINRNVRKSFVRRIEGTLFITLVLLIVLLMLEGSSASLTQAQSSPSATHKLAVPIGPYVGPVLNGSQIDALHSMSHHITIKQLADQYVSKMSLDEELGQLIIVQYFQDSYSPDLQSAIQDLHAGGVLIYQRQMRTFDQTKHDISEMQNHAKVPLLITTDQEGGYVNRLGSIYPRQPGASEIASAGDPHLATQVGMQTAHDMLSLGLNTNLAPVVDISIAHAPEMETRTFGDNSHDVITYAGDYLTAMQKSGVIGCLKHYPGLGSTDLDPHLDLPVINRSKDEIYSLELAPYKAFLQSKKPWLHPGMIMSTDLLMPAIDPKMPAELSPIFIHDILRKQLGYDGVVTTDALYMEGIAARWTLPQAVVLAIKAGDDMVMGIEGTYQMQEVLNALKQAVSDGTLSKLRIDESVSRIIALKMQYHMIPATPPQS